MKKFIIDYWPIISIVATIVLSEIVAVIPDKWVPYIGIIRRIARRLKEKGVLK